MTVTAIFQADTPLLEDETIETDAVAARNLIASLDITRIREVGTPDLAENVGNYVLVIEYASILVGAHVILIS